MKLIQLLIVLTFFSGLILYLKFFQTRILNRVLMVLFFITGMVMGCVPGITVMIARFLGVGRGADLTLYLWILISVFVNLILFLRFESQEKQIVDLVRSLAIRNAERFPGSPFAHH